MFEDFTWIYLLFFLIPLMQIIPRILRKMKKQDTDQMLQEEQFILHSDNTKQQPTKEISKSQTKDMIVLGEICMGIKTFEHIKKNTGLDSNELNPILEELEKQELMRVEQKKGIIGLKVELHPTEKGFRKFQS